MNKHSFLSPKCFVLDSSSIHRNGVVAQADIPEGEIIALWGGFIISDITSLPEYIQKHEYPVQVAPGFYLGPRSVEDLDDAEMFNHSCTPNAGVVGQILLVARRDIQAGEEVCFDYGTTESDGCNFECRCNSPKCRGHIQGQDWKDPVFQEDNYGFMSSYLIWLYKKQA